jgi:hypothetical protein
MAIDMRYFAWYIVGDMAVYLAQKFARGDFHYWVPVDGVPGICISLFTRIIVKTITDYTGVIQFRHPGELGGIYWTANMVAAVIFSFVATELFIGFLGSHGDDPNEGLEDSGSEDGVVLRAKDVRTFVWLTSAAWLLTFIIFLKVMKKEYIGTFFSMKLGKEVAMDYFLEDDDASKAVVLTINRKQWRAIEGEVKTWVQEGWTKWEDEHPEWFGDVFKSGIPEDWLSPEELRRQKMAGGGTRRKSSAFAAQVMVGKKSTASVTPVDRIVDGDDNDGNES